jgi:hypothetical protein
LINFLFRHRYVDHRIKNTYLDAIPVPVINFSDPSEKACHDRMVSLVEQMLELHKRLHGAKTTAADRELYQRQIDATTARLTASSMTCAA